MTSDQHEGGAGGRVLVLGIGNILWADEGFGVRTVEYLAARYEFPAPVELMDGGTQGLYLLPHLEDLAGLVIVDAIDFGLPPATVHEVHGADVPATIGARKMSLHQTGFQEVLALLDLRGHAPRRVSLIGVQPVTMKDYGGGLTPAVAARVEPVARAVLGPAGP
ncbi:HyaD/HybD family hydrogenase maturation endopeptidase, partial [Komagataeibacter kakiaceti]|uniref:HyaD/HybD family hydrogenase maturation endopeptidase n=1 Tax=Komagataeibacter kakiaceti TaxID=943261 RepID=UPI000472E3BA